MADIKCRWPFPKEKWPLWWRICSPTVINFVGSISKFWLRYCTQGTIHNEERLHEILKNRPKNQSLITVANHESCIDDPLLFGMLTYGEYNSDRSFRWSLGAHNICFTTTFTSYFFGLGHVIPIVRGDGVHQAGMNMALDMLDDGGWVHIFPEARVNLEKECIRYKWGVGRLINDCEHIPMVVPIYHIGMDDVLPNYKPYYPRFGKKVTILIGDPIDFTEMVIKLRNEQKDAEEIRHVITARIQTVMENLKKEAHILHEDV